MNLEAFSTGKNARGCPVTGQRVTPRTRSGNADAVAIVQKLAAPPRPAPKPSSAAVTPTVKVTDVGEGHHYNSCAVVGGQVKCWGTNQYGQLGQGTTQPSTTYYVVPTLVGNLSTGGTAVAIARYYFGCAVVNGAVKCWGTNNGMLGNSSTIHSYTPVQVTGLTSGAVSVTAGILHACALANGSVLCWGSNNYGQLGNASSNNSTFPVQVQGLTSGVTAISAGDYHTCAVASGAVWCWGHNNFGQLGNYALVDSTFPVQARGLASGAVAIGAGSYHTCAVISGEAYCWGSNQNGQLGNNTTSDARSPVRVLFP
jgi:alpha-tubulin suppressor-like RCC1 family protein